MKLALVAALLILVGCGGSPTAGPSPLPATPPTSAPAAIVFPAGIDTALVQAIAYGGSPGHPVHRWPPGTRFHHCIAADLDQGAVGDAAALMSRLTGLAQTQDGPCNVTWVLEHSGHPVTELAVGGVAAGGTEILSARITLLAGYEIYDAGHETGHAMGLAHSPRPQDLMYPTLRGGFDFSADELAILAVMYPATAR